MGTKKLYNFLVHHKIINELTNKMNNKKKMDSILYNRVKKIIMKHTSYLQHDTSLASRLKYIKQGMTHKTIFCGVVNCENHRKYNEAKTSFNSTCSCRDKEHLKYINEFRYRAAKKTILTNHGVDNIFKCEKWQENRAKITFEKLGVSHPKQLNFNIDNFNSITKEIIKEKFIDEDGYLRREELMAFVGTKNNSTIYKLCLKLGVLFNHKPGGFDPNKSGMLYYVFDTKTKLYKSGITNYNIKFRFGTHFDRLIILSEDWFQDGFACQKEERRILKEFKKYRITNSDWSKDIGGQTEFFSKDILNRRVKEENDA